MVFTEVDLIGILHSIKKQSFQVTKISFKLLQKCNFSWLNSLFAYIPTASRRARRVLNRTLFERNQ